MQNLVQSRINIIIILLSVNITKWSNALKQFVGKLPTNCLSVFGHFVGLVLNGLYIVVFQIIFNAGNTWMLIFNADWT